MEIMRHVWVGVWGPETKTGGWPPFLTVEARPRE